MSSRIAIVSLSSSSCAKKLMMKMTYFLKSELHHCKFLVRLLIVILLKCLVYQLVINGHRLFLFLTRSFLLLNWRFIRFWLLLFFWLLHIGFNFSSRNLFNVIKHWGVSTYVAHKHPQIWVPHWKFNLFLSQLPVQLLKPREIVLPHHKCISPDLNESQKLVLCFTPPYFGILLFQRCNNFMFSPNSF